MTRKDRAYKGIFPVMQCPFHDVFSVDEDELLRFTVWLIGHEGIGGLAPNGHTGEVFALIAKQRAQVTRLMAEEVAGRLPVVSGLCCEGVTEAKEHAHRLPRRAWWRYRSCRRTTGCASVCAKATWWTISPLSVKPAASTRSFTSIHRGARRAIRNPPLRRRRRGNSLTRSRTPSTDRASQRAGDEHARMKAPMVMSGRMSPSVVQPPIPQPEPAEVENIRAALEQAGMPIRQAAE